MPFPGGLWWLLCCRQGFTLLRRDYGEAGREEEETAAATAEESFELRSPAGEGPTLQVTLTQPSSRASSGSERSLPVTEEMHSLITEKKCGRVQGESDAIVKGWLQREVRGGIKTPWLRPRKYWFVLTEDSLDYYSGCEMSARRLGSLVLTSLCSVLWPDKQTYKETGYWAVTVFGRKHCYRLYTEHLNEAVHWVCALQKVIVSKAPVQTPTQILMCDIEDNRNSPEILDQIYHNNPVLCYTGGPIYAPLLPFPYAAPGGQGYSGLRDEAVKVFHSLQQLEGVREPALLMQGVLQTCHDLPPLVDEIYCQLVKQTTEPPVPGAPSDLRYWQLLTCMSCTFLPSLPVLCYLQLHLQRTENRFPDSEMVLYGHFITEALCKTKGRECVPSLDEITRLMRRQEMVCTVHCPGTDTCQVAITSHTTVQELSFLSMLDPVCVPFAALSALLLEMARPPVTPFVSSSQVARELMLRLGLACSPNSFVLYEESWQHGCPLPEDALVADILARFENLTGEEQYWKPPARLWFRHYGRPTVDSVPCDSQEFALLFKKIFSATRGFITAVLSAGRWDGTSLAKQQVEQKERQHSHLQSVASIGKWKLFQVMRQLEVKPTYLSLADKWLAFGFALFDAEAYEAKEIVQHLQASMFSITLQQETLTDYTNQYFTQTAKNVTLPKLTDSLFALTASMLPRTSAFSSDTCSRHTSGNLCS